MITISEFQKLKSKIKNLKLELIKTAEKNEGINNKETLNKSQELDKSIVKFMKKKQLAG